VREGHETTGDRGNAAMEEQGAATREKGMETGERLPEAVLKGRDFSRADKNAPTNEGSLAPDADPASAQQGPGAPPIVPRTLLESRLEALLAELSSPGGSPSATIRQGHLALLKRWYYRPEARREGEIFFLDAEERWPIKAILRGVGRVAAKAIVAPPAM
jgi:hypothetical protein